MIPVEKNKTYNVKITDISSDGNGIAKTDGYTIFVPCTVPGDEAEIMILKVKTTHAFAKVIKITAPSAYRAEPPCPSYSKCGGCNMLHIQYASQLEFKKKFADDALKRIGGFKNFSVEKIIGAENPYRYRNKMVFPFGYDADNNTTYGFFRARSHDIVPLTECLLGDEANTDILFAVSQYMKDCKVSPYDEKKHTGIIRRVFTRKSHTNNEIMVVISANSDFLPESEKLAERLVRANSRITSIILNINKDKNNLVLGYTNKTIYGKSTITDTLCGLEYEISPNSFFQINPEQTERLYSAALDLAQIEKSDTVMDIYCGIGTISLCAAKYAKNVIGVEIVESAIQNARKNAKRNNITNASFYTSDAQLLVPRLLTDGPAPDIVILDPPRKGSDEETLRAVAAANPKRIVYVSCNPATLARDARFLSTLGYYPKKAVAVDMFPNTTHVETVVQLVRKKPDAYIDITVDMDELDLTVSEAKATYKKIKEYTLEKQT